MLEKFLDDDEDMHDLNLTANEVNERAENEPEVSVGITDASIAMISHKTSLIDSFKRV